ncbi:Lipoprotein signal peptidase [bioreactor metagenome]|uniref:Lipoprotein signal peptidase n=1 Tax=bioreactor metagenome TaxID=1076179 RepID=A0A644X544_9ZZZZ
MFYFFIIVILIGIDQWTKYLAETQLKPIDAIPLVRDVFHLTYARNTGAAFSILREKQVFLIIVSTIIVVVLIYYLIKTIKTRETTLKIALALIIGGALGNLIDRIRLNYVTDFLDFTLVDYPIFNFADVFVVLGVVLLSYIVLFKGDMI